MARPPSGPPPVETSAVAVARQQEQGRERVDVLNYRAIADAMRREDRRAELLAMFGGNEELAGRFLSVALHAISTNSDLLVNATPTSIIQAIKDSAALGLEPTGLNGEGWIIRYKSTAVFQPGWRGYLKRIRNSGKVQDIDTQLVFEHDKFDWGYSQNGGWFTHVPAKLQRDPDDPTKWIGRGDYWGAYAYAVMPSGFVELEVMPTVDINEVRDRYSESFQKGTSSPWLTNWGEMARKTPLRRLSKRLPQAAVDLLLIADDRIEQLRAGDEAGPKMDVNAARNAALAGASGMPQIAAAAMTGAVTPEPDEDTAADEEPTERSVGLRTAGELAAERTESGAAEPTESGVEPVDEDPDVPWAGAPHAVEDPEWRDR